MFIQLSTSVKTKMGSIYLQGGCNRNIQQDKEKERCTRQEVFKTLGFLNKKSIVVFF